MSQTTVIHIKDVPSGWKSDMELRRQYQYIGRKTDTEDGYFGNPFPITPKRTRTQSLREYWDFITPRLDYDFAFRQRVLELHGKILVCYCKPFPCHGDYLAQTADILYEEAQERKRLLAITPEEREFDRHELEERRHDLLEIATEKARHLIPPTGSVEEGFSRLREWRKRFLDPALAVDLVHNQDYYPFAVRMRLAKHIK